MKGWGPKSSVCPSKPGKPNFLGGISRDFAGISRAFLKSLSQRSFCCDPSRHLQESPGPPGPKSQKSLKKGPFGGLEKSLEKYPKKSKNIDFRTFLGIFSVF